MLRPDLRARFDAAVRRGLTRADRERAADLARIRPARRLTDQERKRLHDRITAPRGGAHWISSAAEEDDR